MEKKYQVFILSTYMDLKEERRAVQDTIISMEHFPVGMELFSAEDAEQWEVIKRTIDSSDYYVLILGNCYGTLVDYGDDAGISYTEKEYRYAKAQGIPIYAFIISEDAQQRKNQYETDTVKAQKLEQFKHHVSTGRVVQWWNNQEDLKQKVMNALFKSFQRNERPGWVRGDSFVVQETQHKILLNNMKRAPKLQVKLYADSMDFHEECDEELFQNVDSMCWNDDGSIFIKMKEISTTEVEAEYLPVSQLDFWGPLRGKVTQEEIERYNAALPSKDQLQEYISEYLKYNRIKQCGIPIEVIVDNEGTAKATDLFITLEFPEEIAIHDIDLVKEMKEPQRPDKPEDLQAVAYRRAHPMEASLERLNMNLYGNMILPPTLNFVSSGLLHNSNVYESISYGDQTMEIEKVDGILHTKSEILGAGILSL